MKGQITSTYPAMVMKVGKCIGNGITHHSPTKGNTLGQSGLHTFCDDLMDIVLNSPNEREAYKNLFKYFEKGELEL